MTCPPPNPVRDNGLCERIVIGAATGVLVMSRGDEPYAVPMNHSFFEGRLYFHCAPEGMKLDFLRANPKVVYVVTTYFGPPEKYVGTANCHGKWESAIVYGTAAIPADDAAAGDAFVRFMDGQGRPGFVPTREILAGTRALVVTVDRMTVRREPERKMVEFYEWRPEGT